MCPNYEPEVQGRDRSFRVCHALGRLAILLHTEGFVDSQMATTVSSVQEGKLPEHLRMTQILYRRLKTFLRNSYYVYVQL